MNPPVRGMGVTGGTWDNGGGTRIGSHVAGGGAVGAVSPGPIFTFGCDGSSLFESIDGPVGGSTLSVVGGFESPLGFAGWSAYAEVVGVGCWANDGIPRPKASRPAAKERAEWANPDREVGLMIPSQQQHNSRTIGASHSKPVRGNIGEIGQSASAGANGID